MRKNQYGQPIGEALPHWQPAGIPGHTPLQGRFCRLEPLNLARWGDALYQAYQTAEDDRDWTYLFWERPQSHADFQRYLQAQVSSADRNTMVVIDQTNGHAVGTCAFLRIDPGNGVAELGTINWSPLMKRSALGSEAIFLMLRHLFDDLGYRRCEWKCDSLNLPSRQAVVVKGRSRDTDWLSIVDGEWPARYAAFAAWLSPDNISEDGRQERRLQAFQRG